MLCSKILILFLIVFSPTFLLKYTCFFMILFLVIYNLNKYKPNLTKGLNNNESKIFSLLYLLFIFKIIQRELTNICEICLFLLIFLTKIALFISAIKKFLEIRIRSIFKNKSKANIKGLNFLTKLIFCYNNSSYQRIE